MANISTAHGSYTFNFANVKANNEKKVAWIKEFAKLTSEPYYETYFYDAESLTSVSVEGDEITLPFVGSGHWSYRNNIYWFEGGGAELKEIVLRMDGIKIDIDYKEYEPGGMFVFKGSYTVEVKGGEVSIIERSYERDDLNENTFVDWDFGTIDEYKEILSRGEEAKKKKTGLYQATLNYAYRDPESDWWVEPSDTYCAFTSAEKAKEFAIEKIKREWSHLTQISELEFVEQNPEKDADELESVSIVIKEILILDIA